MEGCHTFPLHLSIAADFDSGGDHVDLDYAEVDFRSEELVRVQQTCKENTTPIDLTVEADKSLSATNMANVLSGDCWNEDNIKVRDILNRQALAREYCIQCCSWLRVT